MKFSGSAVARVVTIVVILLLCTSCRTVPNKAWSNDADPMSVGSSSKRMVIEVDEAGPLFPNGRFEHVQRWLEDENIDRPLIVFVNGWHHNAQPDDENLSDFNEFLASIEGYGGKPVNGLYVGWRGDSFDTFMSWEPSDVLSIWDRKCASIRVGEGGLRHLVAYLRQRHAQRQVIIIGHSLGGSALFHAIKSDFASDVGNDFEYIMLNPAVASKELEPVLAIFRTAFAQAGSRGVLSTSMAVAAERGYRKLTVIQSMADSPVGLGYRIAFLATPVGFSKKLATHRAFLCGDGNQCAQPDNDPCTVTLDRGRFVIEATPPKGKTCTNVAANPVWVIRASSDVSDGHNDILDDSQANALADLIGRRIRRFGRTGSEAIN